MARWVIRVTDVQLPSLVNGAGTHYESPPHSDDEARALLRVLLRDARRAGDPGPWRQAIAGGQRFVELRRVREQSRSERS